MGEYGRECASSFRDPRRITSCQDFAAPVNEPYNPSEEPPLELAQMLYVPSPPALVFRAQIHLIAGWRFSFPTGTSVASTFTRIASENL